MFFLTQFFCIRSAPASPTHGLQFHPPSAPPMPVSRETSPTKTVPPVVEAHQAAQSKPLAASPTHRPFAAGSQGPTHLVPVVATPLAAPGSQLVRPVAAAASLAVSVIKSAPVEPAKQVEPSEMEKNGLSQSSEDESPVQSPKTETKMPMASLKPQEPTSIAGSVGEYCL